jgi:hypothetical protein
VVREHQLSTVPGRGSSALAIRCETATLLAEAHLLANIPTSDVVARISLRTAERRRARSALGSL